MQLNHLDALETESIHIMREVMAEAERPAMLYSIGKNSFVMLHLALKALYPAKTPFPLLHLNTTWKFQEMIRFRNRRIGNMGRKLIYHANQEGLAQGI